jgi:hypothetical protein
MFSWSKNMERKFIKLYARNTDEEVSRIMKLPYSFVVSKAEELGLSKEEPAKRDWTAEELKWINATYPFSPNSFLADRLNAEKWQIEHVAYRMELRKNKDYYKVAPDDNDLVEQWTKEYDKGDYHCSKGHFLTGKILRHLFPYQKLEEEVPVGRLWIDWLMPHMNIACEVHGQQHLEFNPHFHNTMADFVKGQENDWQKSEMLESQDISLFVIYHDEKISINLFRAKLEEII